MTHDFWWHQKEGRLMILLITPSWGLFSLQVVYSRERGRLRRRTLANLESNHQSSGTYYVQVTELRDFLGGPVVKTALPMKGAWGLIPGQEARSCMLQIRPRADNNNNNNNNNNTHTHTRTHNQALNPHDPGRELRVVCPIHRWQNGIDGHAGTPSQKWNDSQTWDLNQYTVWPLIHLPHRQYCFSKHTGRATCQALCQLLSIYFISFNSHNSFMRKVLPDTVPVLQIQKLREIR